MNVHLSVSGRTDIGHVRAKNEDAFVVADLTGGSLLEGQPLVARFDVGERGVLLAVSDGMGGHHAGEVASALVIESLSRSMATAALGVPRDVMMENAVQKAHRAVWQAANVDGREGMGATLTAVFIHGSVAYVAEVGDSRAYLVRGGEITQLTHDQSLLQQLLDAGVIAAEDAGKSPLRNVLTQAMGHQKDIKVALGKLELRHRDCLVLCSDGLYGAVSDDEIRSTVLTAKSLDAACARLVELANERGGRDNITVVVGGVGGTGLPPCSATERVEETFVVLDSFAPKPPQA